MLSNHAPGAEVELRYQQYFLNMELFSDVQADLILCIFDL